MPKRPRLPRRGRGHGKTAKPEVRVPDLPRVEPAAPLTALVGHPIAEEGVFGGHDPMGMERMLSAITRLTTGNEFASDEELQAFVSGLLADGTPPRVEPVTPLERAQDLIYDAFDARGPRRVALARRALALSPDCADAHVLLAEETARSAKDALPMYRQGVAAGERAIGPDGFAAFAGHFWGHVETRPYMRARLGMAQCLAALDRDEEAIGHARALLDLNPGDNQGVRYFLLGLLLDTTRDAEAAQVLADYPDEWSARWCYARTLLAFRADGDTSAAREALTDALRANPHVPGYLLGTTLLPARLPELQGLGDETEAQWYLVESLRQWIETPGALDWLDEATAGDPPVADALSAAGIARNGPRFFLNPYLDAAFTRCPECDAKTMVRVKHLAVVARAAPPLLLVVKTNGRVCEPCDLLIAKQADFDAAVDLLLDRKVPETVGTERVAIGTIDRPAMRFVGALEDPRVVLSFVDLFRDSVIYEPQHYGWVRDDEAAPPDDGAP